MYIFKKVKNFISNICFSNGNKEKLSSKELLNPKREIIPKNNNKIYTKKNFYYISNEENKTNDSFSSSIKESEDINNYKKISLRQKYDERNKVGTKKYLNNNISQNLPNNKSPSTQEESKNNYNLYKKAKSPQKENLKFNKTKENNERYLNSVEIIEEKKDNEIKPESLYGFNLYILIQCLFYIKELREYFIKNQNKFTEEQSVCKAFAQIMNDLKNNGNNYIKPKQFEKIMGNINNLFKEYKTEDLKILFINLINIFISELTKDNKNDNNSENNDIDNSNKKQMFDKVLKDMEKDNIINKLFFGYYEDIYDCTKSKINTYSFETQSCIIFQLQNIKNTFITNKLSLELCFQYYYREKINSEFQCSKCKIKHKGKEYGKIYRPPKIMVIVLDRGHGKRFKEDIEINKYLDLKNIIDEDEYEYSSLYKLICVSTHSGESSSTRGHYTASCLADNNKYYYFSDTYVKEIDDNNIINNEPYLLFYEQINIDDKNEINNIKNEIKTIQIIKQLNDYKNKFPDDSINYYKGKNNKSKEKVIYIDNLSSNILTEFKEINSNKNIEQKLDEENKITRNKNLNNINSQYLHYNTYLSKQEEESKNNYNSPKNAKNLQKEFEFESKKLKENNKKYNNQLGVIEEQNYSIIKPKGLCNINLNCYMNSVLQCLFYIKELREYFIKNQKKFTDEQTLCKAFAEVMDGLKNNDKEYFKPKKFMDEIEKKNNLFGKKGGDAKDLFIDLISYFLEELNKDNDSDNDEESNKDIDFTNKREVFEEELMMIKKDNHIINELFIGYYENIYYCKKTNINTYSFETESFILFNLENIKKHFNTSNLSIELGFKYYYKEKLNSEFQCSKCEIKHKGKEYVKIYRPPKIMVIILDRGHGKIFKGDVEINKYLDLKNIIDEDEYEYSSLYKLICVSTHSGESSSTRGHYTASCLADNNKYYYFSDTYVKEIDDNNIINNEPYLLFYEQIDINDKNEIDHIKNEIKIIQIDDNNNKKDNKNYSSSRNNKNKKKYENQKKEETEKNNRIRYNVINSNKNNLNEIRNNQINSNQRFNNYDIKENEKTIYKKRNITYNQHKINYNEIKSAFKIFSENKNTRYIIDYYYPDNSNPCYNWKLTIIGQNNTPYFGGKFDFHINLSKPFKNLTDNITIEKYIYHLNFGEDGKLLFDIEYNENKSFYENLKELFELLFNLFIEPNCELSTYYSKAKIKLYNNDREKYNKIVRNSVKNNIKYKNYLNQSK